MKYSNIIIDNAPHFYDHNTFCVSLPLGAKIHGIYTHILKDLTEYSNPNKLDLTLLPIADGTFELIVMLISYDDDVDENNLFSRSFVVTSENIKDDYFKLICQIDNGRLYVYEVIGIPENSKYIYLLFC